MWIVGQSLELHRPQLHAALLVDDRGAIAGQARSQVALGAQAIDVNVGTEGSALDLRWAAGAVRLALPRTPLFLDAGSPATLALALELCERDGVAGPLVANALPAGPGEDESARAALLRALARPDLGVVISPRGVDAGAPGRRPGGEELLDAVRPVLAAARAAGVTGPCYVDGLAYPPAHDAARTRRALEVARAVPAHGGATALLAVGNVAHGAPRELRSPLRQVFAAAAVGAGVGALILPVEDRAVMRAVSVAAGERPPADGDEAWLRSLAEAVRDATPVPRGDALGPALRTAARMTLGRA